ncbi:hypothetical protein BDB01DRAFT_697641, partial [Pilobolus umbonatus]
RYDEKQWKRIWRLPIPHKAFNPWWRLIHGVIEYRAKLFARNSSLVESTKCRFCSLMDESLIHMMVECHFK